MLKFAYELGMKLALSEGMTPDQMSAAQNLGMLAGGGLGAAGGGLLGKYIGQKISPQGKGRDVGTILGALTGAGIGGFAGRQAPKLLKRQEDTQQFGLEPDVQQYYAQAMANEAPQGAYPNESESALGLLPSAYDYGGAYSPEYGYYPEY